MGVSTDGIICFGWYVGEVALPWQSEEDPYWDGDEYKERDPEDWWYFGVHGDKYKQTLFPYDEDGEYNEGWESADPRLTEYYEERRNHKASCPSFPIQDINVCSYGCPIWVLAVPGTQIVAMRGYPEEFKPNDLLVDSEKLQKAKKFVNEFIVPTLDPEYDKIPDIDNPKWYLGSFYGC